MHGFGQHLARSGFQTYVGVDDATDEVVLGVVKKSVAGLKETIPLARKDGRDTSQQEAELALLESLLPKAWDKDAIAAVLAPLRDELRAARCPSRRAESPPRASGRPRRHRAR